MSDAGWFVVSKFLSLIRACIMCQQLLAIEKCKIVQMYIRRGWKRAARTSHQIRIDWLLDWLTDWHSRSENPKWKRFPQLRTVQVTPPLRPCIFFSTRISSSQLFCCVDARHSNCRNSVGSSFFYGFHSTHLTPPILLACLLLFQFTWPADILATNWMTALQLLCILIWVSFWLKRRLHIFNFFQNLELHLGQLYLCQTFLLHTGIIFGPNKIKI